jgi:nucleotidyltransferase/DNA polymerase involved in DNA repair
VGPQTARVFEELGIKTSKNLAEYDTEALEKAFGSKKGRILQQTARGIDDSPVEEKEAQQISRMGTLKKDSDKPEEIMEKIQEMAKDIDKETAETKVTFRTISIIAIDTRLQTRTKSHTTIESKSLEKNLDLAKELFEKYFEETPGKLRRVGIRVANLSHGEQKPKKQKTLGEY